jgi:hypothetical protein
MRFRYRADSGSFLSWRACRSLTYNRDRRFAPTGGLSQIASGTVVSRLSLDISSFQCGSAGCGHQLEFGRLLNLADRQV